MLVRCSALALALSGCSGALAEHPLDAGMRRGDATVPADGRVQDSSLTDASAVPPRDVGTNMCMGAGCTCIRAREMWREDFETGDYSRWTGRSYMSGWGNACQNNGLTNMHPYSGSTAQRSEIVCVSPEDVHRGYGGLQWSGDTVLGEYTNRGVGLDAPNGIVTTFHTWLEAGYSVGDGRWMSLFTVNPTCDYTERVITLGLDNADGIIRPAHYWPEGNLTIEPTAAAMPRGRWVRITVYLNFYSGEMHVWQDGQSVEHVSGIVRATRTMCQWHWGLYASGDNTDVVLYEDDKVIWKLEQPWTDFAREPWLGETQAVCD